MLYLFYSSIVYIILLSRNDVLLDVKNKIARNEFNLYGRAAAYGKFYGSTPNVNYTSNNNNNNNNNTNKTFDNNRLNGRTQNKKNRYLFMVKMCCLKSVIFVCMLY